MFFFFFLLYQAHSCRPWAMSSMGMGREEGEAHWSSAALLVRGSLRYVVQSREVRRIGEKREKDREG